MSSVALSEVQASLSLFAEAIAGEPVAFDPVDDHRSCWPWRPSDPESRAVQLPSVLGADAVVGDYRTAYRSLVLQQLLGGHGAALDAEPGPTSLGLDRRVLDRVYAVVEDARSVATTRRLYPGAVADLERLLASGRASHHPDPSDLQERWLTSLRLLSLGESIDDVSTRRAGVDEHLCLALQRELNLVEGPQATLEVSWAVAIRICRLMDAVQAGRPIDEMIAELDEDPDLAPIATDDNDGVALDGGTPSEFEDVEGLAGGQPLSDAVDQSVPMVEGERAAMPGLELPTAGGRHIGQLARTFVYDEWDYHEQSHRLAWCRVIEERLVGDQVGFLAEVRARHIALRSQIRRRFARLRPSDLVRVYRADDGEELDLDAAIEAMSDRRGGAPADDRVQIRRDRAARDVATAFLLDLSASTSSAAVPIEPQPLPPDADPFDDPLSYGPIWDSPAEAAPVRRVIDVAKDAVVLMGDALHELGDRYAIYGFSGTGRYHVEFKVGKDFADRSSPATWAGVAAMKPLRYTRMGPAVRHATVKLAAESARTKLLIVLSDGYPQDTDYGVDRHDRDYGVHDTARALADAAARGIETFCLTIDPAGHDYLRTMCPDHRYAVIEDVESLPEELAKLYLAQAGH